MRWSLVLAALLVSCGATPPRPAGGEDARPSLPALDAAVHAAHEHYSPAAALSIVAHADRYFRVRGNEGYQKTLERVRDELRACGIPDVSMYGLGPTQPSWTPRSASLELLSAPQPQPLIRFESEREPDRATLLVRSDATPRAELEVIRAEAVRAGADAEGRVILAEGSPGQLFESLLAPSRAAGLLVRYLESYHEPDRQPEAAQFGYLPVHEGSAFGFSLSQRVWEQLRGATERGPARVRVAIDVEVGSSAATLVEARLDGSDPEAGAIVFVAHVDEPGANDNGSGVGAVTELACALRRSERAHARSFVFLVGQEMEVSQRWLEETSTPVAAGLVFDMVGEDPAIVGAPFLIERMPDPGAIWLREPDEHTEWGQSEVSEAQLRGHFLNDLMVAAAQSVSTLEGGWRFTTNPFEGGSDHQSFLERDLPAVLGWHFTDSAYHTTLDRMDRVSAAEMHRVAAAFGGAALMMASGERADGLEVLSVVERAAGIRFQQANDAAAQRIQSGEDRALEEHVVDAWVDWYAEAMRSVAAWWPDLSADVSEAERRWRASAEMDH